MVGILTDQCIDNQVHSALGYQQSLF